MNDENRAKLQTLLDEEVSGPLGDKIMNLVSDIVRDERDDAGRRGFNLGWNSAMTSCTD